MASKGIGAVPAGGKNRLAGIFTDCESIRGGLLQGGTFYAAESRAFKHSGHARAFAGTAVYGSEIVTAGITRPCP